jgi:hypothetical protein
VTTVRVNDLEQLFSHLKQGVRRGKMGKACHTYLSHNTHRMGCPEYRRQGLPITTALRESKMKQINRRVKGTERFWQAGGSHNCSSVATTSVTRPPFDAFWNRRVARQTRFCKSRSST